MNHVLAIMTSLNSGIDMRTSLINSLPKRKIEKIIGEREFGERLLEKSVGVQKYFIGGKQNKVLEKLNISYDTKKKQLSKIEKDYMIK